MLLFGAAPWRNLTKWTRPINSTESSVNLSIRFAANSYIAVATRGAGCGARGRMLAKLDSPER
jgi:hypothetical protein